MTLLSIFALPRLLGFSILASLGVMLAITPIVNHIAMFVATRRHNRQLGDAISSQQLSIILIRERIVARDMFIVTLVLVLCVLPKLVAIVLREPFRKLNLYYALYLWSTTLTLLNSCINPVLYLSRNSELRRELKSVFHLWKWRHVDTKSCCKTQEQKDLTCEPRGSRKTLINDKSKWLQLLKLSLKPFCVTTDSK